MSGIQREEVIPTAMEEMLPEPCRRSPCGERAAPPGWGLLTCFLKSCLWWVVSPTGNMLWPGPGLCPIPAAPANTPPRCPPLSKGHSDVYNNITSVVLTSTEELIQKLGHADHLRSTLLSTLFTPDLGFRGRGAENSSSEGSRQAWQPSWLLGKPGRRDMGSGLGSWRVSWKPPPRSSPSGSRSCSPLAHSGD